MPITRFEDIESWQTARLLVKSVYGTFTECSDRSFKDQIQRAAVSIMSNIAEGFDRGSNKEFIQFLVISRASVAEVRSLAFAAFDIGNIDEVIFRDFQQQCIKLSCLINGLIRCLKNSERKC